MKKQETNNKSLVLKNMVAVVAFASAMLVGTSTPSYASDNKKVAATSNVNVKYLGVIDKEPILQVDINNQNEEETYVVLRDENGFKLYTAKLPMGLYSKRFRFSGIDLESMKVTLSVSSRKGKESEVYEINNVTTVVKDMVITKVD